MAAVRVRASYGGLDVLINNAVIVMSMIREEHFAQPVRPSEITPDHWRGMFEVNCMGAFRDARGHAAHGRLGWGRTNVTTSFFNMLNEGFAPEGSPRRRSRRRPRSGPRNSRAPA